MSTLGIAPQDVHLVFCLFVWDTVTHCPDTHYWVKLPGQWESGIHLSLPPHWGDSKHIQPHSSSKTKQQNGFWASDWAAFNSKNSVSGAISPVLAGFAINLLDINIFTIKYYTIKFHVTLKKPSCNVELSFPYLSETWNDLSMSSHGTNLAKQNYTNMVSKCTQSYIHSRLN